MSRHQLKTLVEDFKETGSNVATLEQKCHDIALMDQTYRGNVATSKSDQHVNVETSGPSSLNSEISRMLRHRINVATSVKTLEENCRTIRYNVTTSRHHDSVATST